MTHNYYSIYIISYSLRKCYMETIVYFRAIATYEKCVSWSVFWDRSIKIAGGYKFFRDAFHHENMHASRQFESFFYRLLLHLTASCAFSNKKLSHQATRFFFIPNDLLCKFKNYYSHIPTRPTNNAIYNIPPFFFLFQVSSYFHGLFFNSWHFKGMRFRCKKNVHLTRAFQKKIKNSK